MGETHPIRGMSGLKVRGGVRRPLGGDFVALQTVFRIVFRDQEPGRVRILVFGLETIQFSLPTLLKVLQNRGGRRASRILHTLELKMKVVCAGMRAAPEAPI